MIEMAFQALNPAGFSRWRFSLPGLLFLASGLGHKLGTEIPGR
jgi:hypothetical protein